MTDDPLHDAPTAVCSAAARHGAACRCAGSGEVPFYADSSLRNKDGGTRSCDCEVCDGGPVVDADRLADDLRALAEAFASHESTADRVMRDAADEIERLQALIVEWAEAKRGRWGGPAEQRNAVYERLMVAEFALLSEARRSGLPDEEASAATEPDEPVITGHKTSKDRILWNRRPQGDSGGDAIDEMLAAIYGEHQPEWVTTDAEAVGENLLRCRFCAAKDPSWPCPHRTALDALKKARRY